jgi:hypothetical protein
MNTMSRMACALSIAAVLCSTGAMPAAAQALRIEPRIQLSDQQRARVQAVADQGADALRRFLWRTRMIYGWTWRDLVATG